MFVVALIKMKKKKTKKKNTNKKTQHNLKSKTKCDDVSDGLDQSTIECISLWPLKYCGETKFWCWKKVHQDKKEADETTATQSHLTMSDGVMGN